MRYRQLGSSGLTVSVLGLGCNNFGGRVKDIEQARAVVHAALEHGVTFFDTSDSYGNGGGSESMLGELLRTKRDRVAIATKFGHNSGVETVHEPRASRLYIRKALEASLRRLKTDYIDLYQLHSPDPHTPLEETLNALHELVQAGLVRYVGCSNFTPWELADAHWLARESHLAPFVSVQNNYNLLEREVEAELTPACLRFGVGLLPYYPLAAGLLSGKYRKGSAAPKGSRLAAKADAIKDEKLDKVEQLQIWADKRELTILDVAIGALAAQPAVGSVIAGATTAEQVIANVHASDWLPTDSELQEINAIVPSMSHQPTSGALFR